MSRLRQQIGQERLWLPTAAALVLRGDGPDELLLQHRSDIDVWCPPGGIVEPGEDIDSAAVREVAEETGLDVELQALVAVVAEAPFCYPNGDEVQYLCSIFTARAVSQQRPRCADDESSEVRWWPLAALPPLAPQFHTALAAMGSVDGPRFGLAGRVLSGVSGLARSAAAPRSPGA